jgi:hypothetical protein
MFRPTRTGPNFRRIASTFLGREYDGMLRMNATTATTADWL